MKYKDYNNSRVCAIDYYPLLKEALNSTLRTCKKYNISTVQKRGASDVSKFFYHYCLEAFCNAFKKCPSNYPKVLVVYPPRRDVASCTDKLKKVLSVLPVPWCKCSSFDSPDVEMAVLSALNKELTKDKQIKNFAAKNSLYSFLKDIKKTKYFSVGTVDFTGDTE
jgi:hypothetical protein